MSEMASLRTDPQDLQKGDIKIKKMNRKQDLDTQADVSEQVIQEIDLLYQEKIDELNKLKTEKENGEKTFRLQLQEKSNEMNQRLAEMDKQLKEIRYQLDQRDKHGELQKINQKLEEKKIIRLAKQICDPKLEMERLQRESDVRAQITVGGAISDTGPKQPIRRRQLIRRRHSISLPLIVEGQTRALLRRSRSMEFPPNTSPSVSELRLVLVGRTEAGRSAAGNTILGKEEFETQASPSAVTQRCRRREGDVCGRRLVLVDTPDWFCSGLSPEEMRQEVGLCVRLSAPGPHAFLLVISVELSEEEERGAMERMEEMFGGGCWAHTVILFTYADSRLKDKFLLRESEALRQLVEKCGDTYHLFNIKDGAHDTEVPELLDQVDQMVSGNAESFYSTQIYLEVVVQVREMERKIQREREERKRREEREMTARAAKELQDSLKMERAIQEHERDIRTLNDRTADLERRMREEKDERTKGELERELKRECDRREELERELERCRETRRNERQEMEEIRERYEGEARVEAERNQMLAVLLPELQRNIMISQTKMQVEFNRQTEERNRQMEERNRRMEERNRQMEEEKNRQMEKNREMEERNRQMEEKNRQMEEKNRVLEEVCLKKDKDLTDKDDKLKMKRQELGEKNKRLEERKKHDEDKDKRLETLEKDLQDENRQVEKLKVQLEDKFSEAEEREKRREETATQLKERETQLEDVTQQVREKERQLENCAREAEESRRRQEELRKDLQDKNNHVENLRDQLQDKETELVERDRRWREKNKQLEEKDKLLKETNKRLAERNKQLLREKDRATEEKDKFMTERSRQVQENHELAKQIIDLKLEIERLKQESEVIRTQMTASPPYLWDPMPPNTACQSFTVQPRSPEYKDVLSLFQATCKGNILKIERIQNPSLWKSFELKKKDMESRNRHQNNEKKLFHGTSQTTINSINEHGFNRSYGGKNAALYGNGTYFTINASYSAQDTYSKPDPQGQKLMYLCRVLVGEYTQGQQGMIVPPTKSSTDSYDSVTDNPNAPSTFVIFHDIQAYPEYLITFKN